MSNLNLDNFYGIDTKDGDIFMIFLLVTVISMLISVFLVFKLIKYMGIKLYLKPLLLCAFCAVAFNYLLPWVAIYAASYQFPILLSTTLLAAYAITVYQQRLAAKAEISVPESEPADKHVIATAQPTEVQVSPSTIMAESTKATDIDRETVIPVEAVAAVGFHLPETPLPTPLAITASNDSTAISVATAPLEIPVSVEEPDLIEKSIPKPKLYLIKTPKPVKAETKAIIQPATSAKQTALPAEKPAKPVFPTLNSKEKIRINKITDLDALLDSGFTALNEHNYASAVFAYKRALKLFSSDDYAPFIVIELGNIFKTTGFYDKASAIYQQAFTLPSIAADKVMQKEFSQNIKYLSILQQHLEKAHQENTPFADVSSELLQQAESDFQDWRKQNS